MNMTRLSIQTPQNRAIKYSKQKAFLKEKHIIIHGEFIAVMKPSKKAKTTAKKKSPLEVLESKLASAIKDLEKYTAEGKTLSAEYMKKYIAEYTAQIARIKAVTKTA
jgi:ribose 5-phosphate isomerase